MAWAARVYGKGRIDRAGRKLASEEVPAADGEFVDYVDRLIQREEDVRIVDNWRACHAYPLQVVKMTLLNRAKKIDPDALIAQRLKRRPSINIKLRDNPNMKLSQMHDIGGCRAVLSMSDRFMSWLRSTRISMPRVRKIVPTGTVQTTLIILLVLNQMVTEAFIWCSVSRAPAMNGPSTTDRELKYKLDRGSNMLGPLPLKLLNCSLDRLSSRGSKNASDDWLQFFALTSSAFAIRERSAASPRKSLPIVMRSWRNYAILCTVPILCRVSVIGMILCTCSKRGKSRSIFLCAHS